MTQNPNKCTPLSPHDLDQNRDYVNNHCYPPRKLIRCELGAPPPVRIRRVFAVDSNSYRDMRSSICNFFTKRCALIGISSLRRADAAKSGPCARAPQEGGEVSCMPGRSPPLAGSTPCCLPPHSPPPTTRVPSPSWPPAASVPACRGPICRRRSLANGSRS